MTPVQMNQETTLMDDAQLVASIPSDSSFTLSNCIEIVGMTMVATNAARRLVPAPFRLAGEDDQVTPLVVLAVRGEVALPGQQPEPGVVVQVGLVVVPPDGTGEINVFLCWYNTSHSGLARHLRLCGIEAHHAPIDYTFLPGDAKAPTGVAVRQKGDPLLSIGGSVLAPSERITFVANWWASSKEGSIKMTASIPEAFVGEANLTLTTEPHSAVGQLIGGASIQFPLLQRFNTFAHAQFSTTLCKL